MRLLTSIILLFLYINSGLCFYQSGYVIRDLEATTQVEFSEETKAWKDHFLNTGTAYDTDCGSIYLFGGVGFAVGDGPFQRTYENLPAHQFIAISLETYLIDTTIGAIGPTFEFETASGGFTIGDPSSLTTDYCGSGAVPDLGPIRFFQTFQHTSSTLNFGLQIDDGQGIRNIKILLVTNDLSSNSANWPLGCAITDPVSLIDYFPCGCSQGQYFDGSSCQTCDDACENCFDAGPSSCYTCKEGYYFDGTNCLVCNDPCSTCYGADANSCDTCIDGYYFDGTSSCLSCDSTCATCSASGPNACLTCHPGDSLNANSQCVTAITPVKTSTKTITDVKATTETIVGAGLIANTLVNAGNSAIIRFSMLAKMIQYIKYLDIDYPNDLRYALYHWDDDFINFNSGDLDFTPDSFGDYQSSYHPLPPPIRRYDENIDSSFLMSFWRELIPIFIICAVLVSMVVLELIVSKNVFGETAKKITHQLRLCVQGILIIYLYNDFADIFFFAILSYTTTKKATALSVINVLVSILFIILAMGALIGQTWLVKKYQTLRNKDHEELERFRSKYEGVSILWQDFKDDSLIHMNALVFIVLHNIVFCLILAMMFDHPLAEVILINFLSLAIITYLLWFKPFDEKLELIQTIICEVILFAVNICLLILICLDSDSNSRDNVGRAILVLTMLFNFVPLGFLVVAATIVFKKIYHALKAYLLRKNLDKLKKPPRAHIKNSQIAPTSMIISIKDDVSTTNKFVGNPETTQATSVLLGKKESGATNLLYVDTPNKTMNFFSPTPTPGPIFQFEGMTELDDQFLKAEDPNEDSPSKYSRSSLIASRQQSRLRNSREHWMSQKYKNESEPENVFE